MDIEAKDNRYNGQKAKYSMLEDDAGCSGCSGSGSAYLVKTEGSSAAIEAEESGAKHYGMISKAE
eukprot:11233274-Alexandrium_andersonii.AAC.1